MLFGTFEDDKQFLMDKYRNPVFPPQAGYSNQELSRIASEREAAARELPAETVKADLFEFVCDNMFIDVNPRDFFVSFGCYDRSAKPLAAMVTNRMIHLSKTDLKDIDGMLVDGYESGARILWFDTDHSVPDWDYLMENGFPGALQRIDFYRNQHQKQGTLDDTRKCLFDSVSRVYTKILATIKRFREFGLAHYPDSDRVKMICESLQRLETGAPQNFYDALNLIYLYFMFSEYLDQIQVRSLGNLDVLLLPFYRKSRENGEFTESQMRELMAYFLMQWGSINNYWGQPFYMAGTYADGSSKVNELSYMILEEYDKLDITTPKIQIKVNKNTPRDFLAMALDMIRRGHNSLVFISEKSIERSMLALGRTPEEAADPDITGCYEWGAKANENITQSIHCNLVKMVEIALNDGVDPASGIVCGPRTGKAEDLKSFSDFYEAVLRQITNQIEEIIMLNDRMEHYLGWICPALVFTGAMETALRKGEEGFSKGMKYNSSMLLLIGFSTLIDGLMAVKKMVYEEKLVTLAELRDICRNNWAGHEELRHHALHLPEKMGCGSAETEELAKIVARYLGNLINMRPNKRGGHYMASSHPALQYVMMGLRTGATPDGRLAKEETSKNISPTPGMDRKGVTALIRSITTLDCTDFPGNFTLDVMLHPETVRGSDGLVLMQALLDTYFIRGGNAIQFNIFSPADLRKAQKEPERYHNLQVRICGWNARFLDMTLPEQEAFIKRADNIIE